MGNSWQATLPASIAFSYPWSSKRAPPTEFRALADAERLCLPFTVSDSNIVVVSVHSGRLNQAAGQVALPEHRAA